MKKISFFLLVLMGMIASAADAKQVFIDKGCVKCHKVESAKIETTSKKDPKEVTDLSDIGNKHDKAFFGEFLLKKKELEGKLHKNKFNGDKAELDALIDWLVTLKK